MSTVKRNIAVITAAGFKGVSTMFPKVPRLCPEPLLPLGEEHGGTVVERLSKQLDQLGFKVFATVGEPGYRYTWRPIWNAGHFGFRDDPANVTESPWTKERLREMARYCAPITVPDPDRRCYHDSAFLALDQIGYEWDRCLIMQGDHLFTDSLLKDAVTLLPFPCQLRPSRGGRAFTVLMLTPEAAREYRRLGNRYRAASEHAWNGSMHSETGTKEGKEFASIAPVVYITDVLPSHDEYDISDDIDSPDGYKAALRWLKRGERSSLQLVEEGKIMIPTYEYCIKTAQSHIIYMVRGKEKMAFAHWEDYVAAGKPAFEIVANAMAEELTTVTEFSPTRRWAIGKKA